MSHIFFRKILFCLIVFVASDFTSAQTFDLQSIPTDKTQISFRFDKPFYVNSTNSTALSGLYQLKINIPTHSKGNFICEIPFIYSDYEVNQYYGSYKYTRKGVGNIFIGFQSNENKNEMSKSIYSYGIFLPTTSEKISLDGLFINYYELQKFTPNGVGIYFNYAYHKIKEQGFKYGLEFGPNFIIPTNRNNTNNNFVMHYGVTIGYKVNKLLLNSELFGDLVLSGLSDSFYDRFINMFNFGAQYTQDNATPEVFYRIYLKDTFRDLISGVLGIGIILSF